MGFFKAFRRATPLATALFATLALAPAGQAANDMSVAEIDAVFVGADCSGVEVESTKDLSNVLLLFADGSFEKFEDLSGLTGTFAGTGDNAGKTIVTVLVKSGSYKQGRVDGLPGMVGKEFSSVCAGGDDGEDDDDDDWGNEPA